ncbi:Xanthine dehydrogenase/oxidase [Liparis tanakae]|uniref:Xanthine dehydrogenase/oxidase n=1 Tax=Liparis tanakae TaxID=230148 RepID=A0A4Z2GRU0_9TELE|nr:Xanthine dehydrogenase/oxidase [Liparis tanakae]
MDASFFPAYRRTALRPQEVLVSVCVPFSRPSQFVSVFKQSPRREDDISIVTAAMSVTFAPGTDAVEELRLSYGGVAAVTTLASATGAALRGRRWGEELLEDACSSLAKELTLDPSAPGGMVPYRRALTLSMFYKFYLTVLQKLHEQGVKADAVQPDCRSAAAAHRPEPPSSIQVFQAVPEGQERGDTVGRPMMHLSALKQATGEALYCDDIPLYENELYLALVTSSKAHAHIL